MTTFLEWVGWIGVASVLGMLAIWLIVALVHQADGPIDDE